MYYAVCDGFLVSFTHPTTLSMILQLDHRQVFFANAGELTYFSNGSVVGTLDQGVLGSWDATTYEGPETMRHFTGAPSGKYLCYHNGIMYAADGKFIYHSEPYNVGLWDYASNYLSFLAGITAIWGIGNTLFVSTEEGVFAHIGDSPRNWQQRHVHASPVFHNTIKPIASFKDYGAGAFVTSREGVCFSGANGTFLNMTEDKIAMPLCNAGGAYYDATKYVCSLN